MGVQRLATYLIPGKPEGVAVYGCWDAEIPDTNQFDYFDIYDVASGIHLNEFEPFFAFPAWETVQAFLSRNSDTINAVLRAAAAEGLVIDLSTGQDNASAIPVVAGTEFETEDAYLAMAM